MGTRGRKSSDELSLAPATIARVPRIRPPDWLSKPAADEFRRIVGSVAADHFRPSDAPLLARYAETIIRTNMAEETDEFCKLVRVQAMLAVRLRLAPSTRGHHRTTARQNATGGRDWETEIDG